MPDLYASCFEVIRLSYFFAKSITSMFLNFKDKKSPFVYVQFLFRVKLIYLFLRYVFISKIISSEKKNVSPRLDYTYTLTHDSSES